MVLAPAVDVLLLQVRNDRRVIGLRVLDEIPGSSHVCAGLDPLAPVGVLKGEFAPSVDIIGTGHRSLSIDFGAAIDAAIRSGLRRGIGPLVAVLALQREGL